MGFWNAVKNVATLGGHGRLESALAAHREAQADHLAWHRRATRLQSRLDFRVGLLGLTTTISMKRLRRSCTLLRVAGGYRPQKLKARLDFEMPQIGLHKAGKTLEVFPTSARIAGGAVVGYASVAGSWALMSMVGTSSTGAVLSSLSGAAAYNATMAAFGGGSLAAGGLGIAGGAWVLAGIAVVPAIAFAAWSSHSKANEVNEDRERIVVATRKLHDTVETICAIGTVSEQARLVVLKAWSRMEQRDLFARRLIWPRGICSRVWRAMLRVAGQGELDAREQAALAHLDAGVAAFCDLFNKKGALSAPRALATLTSNTPLQAPDARRR